MKVSRVTGVIISETKSNQLKIVASHRALLLM
jgi:hypothetical protein